MKIFKKGDKVYHMKLKLRGVFLEQDSHNAEMGYVEFTVNGIKEIKHVKGDDLMKYELIYKPIHE